MQASPSEIPSLALKAGHIGKFYPGDVHRCFCSPDFLAMIQERFVMMESNATYGKSWICPDQCNPAPLIPLLIDAYFRTSAAPA